MQLSKPLWKIVNDGQCLPLVSLAFNYYTFIQVWKQLTLHGVQGLQLQQALYNVATGSIERKKDSQHLYRCDVYCARPQLQSNLWNFSPCLRSSATELSVASLQAASLRQADAQRTKSSKHEQAIATYGNITYSGKLRRGATKAIGFGKRFVAESKHKPPHGIIRWLS